MTYDKNITSNNWSSWAKHVLSELERLAILENKQDEQIVELINRVSQLEGRLKSQFHALAWIAGVAAMSLAGLIVWFIQTVLSK